MNRPFKRSEFACQCGCGFDTVDYELIDVLVDLREHFGQRVHITSGCRCPYHNGKVRGSRNSTHPDGKASDFWVENVHADEVADYLEEKYPDTYGIGRYNGRTHVDSRLTKARWDYRK